MDQPAPQPDPAPPLFRELAGEVLRDRRREEGLRLVDVAERAGVSPQYLSEIERGVKDPSSEMLAAVAEALGLGLDDLLVEAARRRGLAVQPLPRMAEVVPLVRPAPAVAPRPTGGTSTIDPVCQAA